jgi:hypothetical protein
MAPVGNAFPSRYQRQAVDPLVGSAEGLPVRGSVMIDLAPAFGPGSQGGL